MTNLKRRWEIAGQILCVNVESRTEQHVFLAEYWKGILDGYTAIIRDEIITKMLHMQQMFHKYFQGVLLLITSYSSEFPAWCPFRGLTILPLNTKWKLILRLIQSHGAAFLCGFVTVLLMSKENWFWGQNVFPVLWLIIWQGNTMVSPTSALYASNVCELFPPSQAENCGKHIKQDYIYRARVYLPPPPRRHT